MAVAFPPFPIQRGKHPGPAHSKPQPDIRSGQRFGLAMQRQRGAPGVYPEGALEATVSTHTGCSHKSKQHLSAESLAGRRWEGVQSGSFPRESTLSLSTLKGSLVLDLGQTDPGRSLPQKQPRSQAAVQPPQFLQPQCPDAQHQPTPHHSLALDRG